MNGIGSKGAHRASPGEGVENVHADLVEAAREAPPVGLHGTAGSAAEQAPEPVGAGLLTAALLVVLTLGLIAATAACLAVIGLALGLWPAALVDAMADGRLAARGPGLAAALAAPLAVVVLLDQSWRRFARGRTGRCADFMLAALAASLALHAAILGV